MGGAGDERTVRRNTAAFKELWLKPRVLTGVGAVDLSVDLAGIRMSSPVMLAPTAFNRLMHPDGERAVARAASATGSLIIASVMASVSLEEIAESTTAPLWLQIYMFRDRGLTQAILERAKQAGYQGVVITVDTPRVGRRVRDIGSNQFHLPPDVSAKNLETMGRTSRWTAESDFEKFNADLIDPEITWRDIEWVKTRASGTVLLKGILSPLDAQRAIEWGASGIVVSNHGGRQLDGAVASIDALPEIAERVDGRFVILLDGGVRRGVDVLSALAMGATGVLIGRPYLWGLAVGGEQGVRKALQLLNAELELSMALSGCSCVADAGRLQVYRTATETIDIGRRHI